MTFPVIFNAQDDHVSIRQWVAENQAEVNRSLDAVGAVLIRGLAVRKVEDFDTFVTSFGLPVFSYQESLSNAVRINFTERVFTANEAPPDVEIFLHHEMAQTPVSPTLLFFCCLSPAATGGATPLCRSDKLLDAFQRKYPEWSDLLKTKGVRYVTRMPAANDESSGQGRSWQSTLNVADKATAEIKLSGLGYSFQWEPDDKLVTLSPALPAVTKLNDGRQSFYHQLIAAYQGWPGVRENPAAGVMFGDRTDIPLELLDCLSEMSAQYTTDIEWAEGEVALVNNKMVMHGRRPYGGDRQRKVLVSMAP